MSKTITKISQIKGTFQAGEDILKIHPLENKNLDKIGFQSNEDNIIILNNQEIQIGKTDRIEYDNLKLSSIALKTDGYIIIDYIYQIEKE